MLGTQRRRRWTRRGFCLAAALAFGRVLKAAGAGPPPRIEEIRFAALTPRQDRVLIRLDRLHPPQTFTLEGDSLRVVCDFYDAELRDGVERRLETDGGCIQAVRVGVRRSGRRRVRVVLDLHPDGRYEVDQKFFRSENVFAITVTRRED